MNKAGEKKTSDTRELGSTLMTTMLKEVSDFCDPDIKENWSLKAHQQVRIYTCMYIYVGWTLTYTCVSVILFVCMYVFIQKA